MIRTKNKLTVLHDDNGVFADYSNEAVDYARDNFGFTLVAANDYLYVGFYKPINTFFLEITTDSTTDTSLAGEYYNGTAYASLEGLHDDSKAFQRSGFIQWERTQTDEAKTTVNSVEQYWYRFKPAADTSALVISGLNIVFADDQDLKDVFYEIDDFLPTGQTSHILTHVSTRNEIVQVLRNGGAFKVNTGNNERKDITAFDLHDVGQINLAAIHLCLSKIFGAVHDDPDGLYKGKSDDHFTKYGTAIKAPFINLDRDDDGKEDDSEKIQFKTLRIYRE